MLSIMLFEAVWTITIILLLFSSPHKGTVLARLAVFPVIVKGQREAAKLNNVLPEMTKLTNRMNEAKQSGNKFDCKYLTPLSMLHLSLQSLHRCLQSVFLCYSC